LPVSEFKVTKCNLVAYDYSGYGGSSGRPSEEAMYQDHMAVFTLVLSRYKLTPKQVVLVGHSIGTVPAVELASKVEVAGVILEAPIISGLKVR
jgi:pimeloyl-ACP methyl ester carboxylesterase